MKILVLGDDTRAFLAVIRSLGRGGAEVHVAWHDPRGPAVRSRYVRKAHRLPPCEDARAAWLKPFQELLAAERFDLVMPCTDPALAALQAHRRELAAFGKIYLLSDEAFEVTSCKFKTAELARSLGVPVARELIVHSAAQAAQIRSLFELPVVLKPRTSFQPGTQGKRKVRKAYAWDDLDRCLGEMLPQGPVSVQENFIGKGVGVELLMHEGRPLLAFQHLRLHEPMLGGGSSYRKGQAVDRALLDASVRLLSKLGYTGVAMVEFKVDPASGRWILMEINGRFWGSLPLAVASGADFPLSLAQLLLQGRRRFPANYREGLCCRNLRADLTWLWANLRADRSDPTLSAVPLPQLFAETLWNVLTLKERSDTLTLDDPLPGLFELAGLFREAGAPMRRKALAAAAKLPFWRKRMRSRALAALERSARIAFVCKGNICRSPFAEQLASACWGAEREYFSAALLPLSARPAPPEALDAARKLGIDLSAHSSTSLDPDRVKRAELIFVFDAHNYEALARRFPEAVAKVHFLGVLAENGPAMIDDPFGKGPQAFERAYQVISDAVRGAGASSSASAASRARAVRATAAPKRV